MARLVSASAALLPVVASMRSRTSSGNRMISPLQSFALILPNFRIRIEPPGNKKRRARFSFPTFARLRYSLHLASAETNDAQSPLLSIKAIHRFILDSVFNCSSSNFLCATQLRFVRLSVAHVKPASGLRLLFLCNVLHIVFVSVGIVNTFVLLVENPSHPMPTPTLARFALRALSHLPHP